MRLDDPGQCRGATLYEGPGFAPSGQDRPAPPRSLHREYLDVLSGLENVLAGFCPPEKYFKAEIQKLTREFLRLLQDRRLPLDEMRDVMATISGRLPSELEKFIVRCLTNYEQNITSVIAQFPAQRITTEIDKLNASMPTADKDIFEMTIAPVVNVCRKYSHGVRGESCSSIFCP